MMHFKQKSLKHPEGSSRENERTSIASQYWLTYTSGPFINLIFVYYVRQQKQPSSGFK